jgi:RNA polymerase sigma factor (sigma-70 family)
VIGISDRKISAPADARTSDSDAALAVSKFLAYDLFHSKCLGPCGLRETEYVMATADGFRVSQTFHSPNAGDFTCSRISMAQNLVELPIPERVRRLIEVIEKSDWVSANLLLVEKYRGYVQSILGHRYWDFTPDVFQEVMVRMWKHEIKILLLHLREHPAWLTRVVHNACIDVLRREGHLDRLKTGFLRFVTAQDRQTADEPAKATEFTELQGAIAVCLTELTQTNREVLRLFYWEGLSREQIASRVGITVALVRTRLHNARTQLRQLLNQRRIPSANWL